MLGKDKNMLKVCIVGQGALKEAVALQVKAIDEVIIEI